MFSALALLVAQSTAAPSFAGVTIGASAQVLVQAMGDPVVRSTTDDGAKDYTYVAPGNALEIVRVEHGNVVSVLLEPGPWKPNPLGSIAYTALGVSLNDPASALAAIDKTRFIASSASGDTTISRFRGDGGLEYAFGVVSSKVHSIVAQLPAARTQSLVPAIEPTLHGGTSFVDAIVVKAPSESLGVFYEYVYIALHPCAGGNWRTTLQSLSSYKGQPYDILQEKCSVGSATRSFYFNIAGYFGKMG